MKREYTGGNETADAYQIGYQTLSAERIVTIVESIWHNAHCSQIFSNCLKWLHFDCYENYFFRLIAYFSALCL